MEKKNEVATVDENIMVELIQLHKIYYGRRR